ncbi:MAG: FecR family protein [Marinobacterium sp.]|nr:FecR family protein [Marinobacterium sp.]
MKTSMFSARNTILATALCTTLNGLPAFAGENAGTVIFAVGDAWILTDEAPQKRLIKHGEQISDNDTLITGPDGHIHLRMADRAFIALRPDSQLKLEEYDFQPASPENDRARLLLKNGSVRTVSGKLAQRSKDRYRLNTPVAAIGVRGTDYTVITTASQSEVDVLRGGIAMSPFTNTCTAASLGPCSGASVVDLYANMKQHYLRLRSGDESPNLMEGRLNNLSRPEDDSSLKRTQTDTESSATSESSQQPSKKTTASNEEITQRADRDGDGVADLLDAFPEDPDEHLDTDNDGIGNNSDDDDDNDGLSDDKERQLGSNPLRIDSDNDGIADSKDRQPARADRLILEQNGKIKAVSTDTFKALQIETVTLARASTASGTSGTVYTQNMQLNDAPKSAPGLVLKRNLSSDGRVFWGTQGSARAFDEKIQTQLEQQNYQQWHENSDQSSQLKQDGVSDKALQQQNNRWDAYYKRDNFAPLVSNNTLYLNNVNGLESARTPEANLTNPALGILYNLSAAQIQSAGDLTPEVADFKLTMHYADSTFTASMTLRSEGQHDIQVTFNGTVNESGMVFGGNEEAYLKGFFVNEMNQIALLFETEQNGQTYSGTLITNSTRQPVQAEADVHFQGYQTDENAPVKWGRWSNFREIRSDYEVQNALPTDRLIARNQTFALMRKDNDVILPTEGVYSFTMSDGEAVYRRGDHLETATINNPSLTVDFNQRTFDTHLTVQAPSLGNGVNIIAQGELDKDGVFASTRPGSNSQVTGVLTNNADAAAMIFERHMEQGTVSGAVEWAH